MIRAFTFFFSFFYAFQVLPAQYSHYTTKIEKYAPKGVIVLNDHLGKEVYSFHKNKALIPASIIKVVTSLVAIETLGLNHQFSTNIYTRNSSDLLIRGGGDPFLTSEEIQKMALEIKKKFKTKKLKFDRLYIDPTSFMDPLLVSGIKDSIEPYDAINAGLVVNFNTVNIKRDKDKTIRSAEEETPLTLIAKKQGRKVKAGQTRRLNLGSDFNLSFRYSWELIRAIFEKNNIHFKNNTFKKTKTSSDWSLLLEYKNSHDLRFLIRSLLRYSNNFIANQIFLKLGVHSFEDKASLGLSRNIIKDVLNKKFHFNLEELHVDEGSGISRNNWISGNAMMQAIEAFRPYSYLLPWHYKTLVKSGTLTGVYNYVGFIPTKKGDYSFVIMMNQKRNKRFYILQWLKAIAKSDAKKKLKVQYSHTQLNKAN